MLGALRKAAHKRKVQKARVAYDTAKAAYDDAMDRGDTRDMNRTWERLRDAKIGLLRAEVVA